MKKIFICLLVAAISSFNSICAQTIDSCGTTDMDSSEFVNQPWFGNNQFLNDFLDSIGYPKANTAARIIDKDKVWYHLPIKIWNIRRSNGTGGIGVQELRRNIVQLNRVFNELNDTKIGFYTTCEISNLNSDNYYSIGGNEFGSWFVAASLTNNYFQPGAINIYFTGSVANAGGVTFRGGVPFGPSRCIVISSSSANHPERNVLAHEMGHYLGLEHTHRSANYPSWLPNLKCYKEPIDRDREYTFLSLCFGNRLKSSIICESTGDALSDTPADPDLSNNTGIDCNNFNSANNFNGWQDPWGDYYTNARFPKPIVSNTMSYGNAITKQCKTQFTRMQIGVMLNYLSNSRLGVESKNDKYIYDEYEPDNTWEYGQYNNINVGEVQQRSFHQSLEYMNIVPVTFHCDIDWVAFIPTCTRSLTIETSEIQNRANANTRLTLFESDHITQLAQNDDISSTNKFSNITYNFIAGNLYFIRVENMEPGITTYYNLNIAGNFTEAQINGPDIVCTSNNYTINNFSSLLSGTSVTWSVSPAGLVNQSCTNCPSTILTLNPSIIASELILTGTISNPCINAPISLSKTIIVGPPPTNHTILGWQTSGLNEPTVWRFEAIPLPGCRYQWYLDNARYINTGNNIIDIPVPCKTQFSIKCKIMNECGMSDFSNSILTNVGYCKPTKAGISTFPIDQPIYAPKRLNVTVATSSSELFGHLFYNKESLANEMIQGVNVYSKSGDIIMQTGALNTKATQLDFTNQPDGTYFIEVIGKEDFRELHTFYYSQFNQEEYFLDNIANGSIVINGDRASERLYVMQQKLFNDLQCNADAMEASNILQDFAKENATGSFGFIWLIQNALGKDEIEEASTLLERWEPINSIDNNFKNYYQYYIKIINNSTLEESELETLHSIAQGCPLTDGEIVYAARDLYNYLDSSNTDDYSNACSSIGLRMQPSITNEWTSFSKINNLYPNPSKGNITIDNLDYGLKTITITNIYGKSVLQQRTNNKTINIHLNLNAGIYFVNITNTKTGKTETQKLIINN